LEAVQIYLDGLKDFGNQLDQAAQASRAPGKSTTSKLSLILAQCHTEIKSLQDELGGHFRNKIRGHLGRRLKWPMKEPKITEFVQKLGRYQQLFQQALELDIG
jgi:hypothetical protein